MVICSDSSANISNKESYYMKSEYTIILSRYFSVVQRFPFPFTIHTYLRQTWNNKFLYLEI